MVQRAGWWASDYLYAIGRQLELPVARARATPAAWEHNDPSLPEVWLIPGVYEHWTFMRPLGDRLAAVGHDVRVVRGMGLNRRSIRDSAAHIEVALRRTPPPPAGRVLVAHSKGGLIGKQLLTSARGSGSDSSLGLIGLVAIATPFGGSRYAGLFLAPSIRAFRPRGATIRGLGSESSVNARIVSVFGPFDPHIPEGSVLDGATNIAVSAPGHFRLLGSAETSDAVLHGIGMLADTRE